MDQTLNSRISECAYLRVAVIRLAERVVLVAAKALVADLHAEILVALGRGPRIARGRRDGRAGHVRLVRKHALGTVLEAADIGRVGLLARGRLVKDREQVVLLGLDFDLGLGRLQTTKSTKRKKLHKTSNV
jgi:hypothetical protein